MGKRTTESVGEIQVTVEEKVPLLGRNTYSVLAVNPRTGKTEHIESADRQYAIDKAVKKVQSK